MTPFPLSVLRSVLKARAATVSIPFLDDPNREVERPRGEHLRLEEIAVGESFCVSGSTVRQRWRAPGQIYLETAVPKGHGDESAWHRIDEILAAYLTQPVSADLELLGFSAQEGDELPAHYTLLAIVTFEYEYTVAPAA